MWKAKASQVGLGSFDIYAATRPQVGIGHLQQNRSAAPLLTHDTGTECVEPSSNELQGNDEEYRLLFPDKPEIVRMAARQHGGIISTIATKSFRPIVMSMHL